MLNSKIVKEAHKMAKEIKREYPEVNYQVQFGLCLSYLLKGEENTMVELKGSEKQVKWAEDIKKELLNMVTDYKKSFNKSLNQRKIIQEYLEEIKQTKEGKITVGEAREILNNLLDTLYSKIELETSAKKLIDVKTSLKFADASFKEYIFKEFM